MALKIKPDCVEAHTGLGLVLAGKGRNYEAIAHLRQALAIKPDYADAKKNLDAAIASRNAKKN